jgi:hypothetical protein
MDYCDSNDLPTALHKMKFEEVEAYRKKWTEYWFAWYESMHKERNSHEPFPVVTVEGTTFEVATVEASRANQAQEAPQEDSRGS